MEDLKPADLTSEDHDWRTCGCHDCYSFRYDVWVQRGE